MRQMCRNIENASGFYRNQSDSHSGPNIIEVGDQDSACQLKQKRFWSYIKSLCKDSSGIAPLKDNGRLLNTPTDTTNILNHHYHSNVKAKENQDKVPTLYWLPKLKKNPYKARFIANSSSCTTTELSKLLTSYSTAVKNMLSNIVKRYVRDPVKTYFGLLKIQVNF